jgi:hypothetical protein
MIYKESLTLKAPSMTPPKVLKVFGSMKNDGTKWIALLPVISGWFVNWVAQPSATEP